jgi:hypothetical protein
MDRQQDPSEKPVVFRLIERASGSDDLGVLGVGVVRNSSRSRPVATAELLKDEPALVRPEPFTRADYEFSTFGELGGWPNNPEIKLFRRDASRR